MMKSDPILVTGARGLVGSAVVEHLKHSGYIVAAVNRTHCDLLNFQETVKLFESINPRPVYVFHAAARVFGIMGNMNNQGRSYLENTLINTHVIEAARQIGVKKITVMGTNAVYPFPPTLPFSENTIFNGRPHSSESAYAHAKRGMLAMLEAYQESYGLEWAYLVSCNLFGPRDKFDPVNGHVIPSLIRKFYEAKATFSPVTVWGDGSAQRDFLYVKDVARIAEMVMGSAIGEELVEGCSSGPINIASGTVMSIREIVEILSDITGVRDIVWDSTKPNGQIRRYADLSRLNALGFKPAYSIADGLRETWEWYRNDRSGA